MLSFTLSKEQELLRDVAREFAQKVVAPRAAEVDRTRKLDMEVVRKYQEQGFHLVSVPKEYGGQGRSSLDAALVLEEMNAACANLGSACINLTPMLHLVPVITPEAKKRWMPYMIQKKMMFAGADTEPDAGSDAASLVATATKERGGWVLNGLKTFCTFAEYADIFQITVRTGPSRYKGLDTFAVERGTPGLKVGRITPFMGHRAIGNAQLILDNCRVPEESHITEPGKGWYYMMYIFDWGRPNCALQMVGIARAAFDASVRYAKERRAFGKPIGEFQIQMTRLAEMKILLDSARLLSWQALDMLDKGIKCEAECSMAKAFAAEACVTVCSEAMTLHGGIGYSEDLPIERYYRDVKAWTLGDGTADIQKLIVGSRVLGFRKVVLDHGADYG